MLIYNFQRGAYPLNLAAEGGSHTVIEQLLDRGAFITCKDKVRTSHQVCTHTLQKTWPMQFCIDVQRPSSCEIDFETLNYMLKFTVQANLTHAVHCFQELRSSLHYAALKDHPSSIHALHKQGVNLEETDKVMGRGLNGLLRSLFICNHNRFPFHPRNYKNMILCSQITRL